MREMAQRRRTVGNQIQTNMQMEHLHDRLANNNRKWVSVCKIAMHKACTLANAAKIRTQWCAEMNLLAEIQQIENMGGSSL